MTRELTAIDLFSGAGGFALGLERVGFRIVGAIEDDLDSVETIRFNRPSWPVSSSLVNSLMMDPPVDLLSAAIPSDLISEASKVNPASTSNALLALIDVVESLRPAALVLLSVRGLAMKRHHDLLVHFLSELRNLGYRVDQRMVLGSDHGLLQERARLAIVGLQPRAFNQFDWPTPTARGASVGEMLVDLMAAEGWPGAAPWASRAIGLAPTIVGGSKKHGGADLGPTRAKQAWLRMGIDPRGVADTAPVRSTPLGVHPRLTNRMVARLQSFEDDWRFVGKKTSVFRQIASATPPVVAAALGAAISEALRS